ncbi:hypothetical protein BDZ89DRAFT_1136485 [Hymenopellis radicata]|nr:hypothetical protein BDZ89DRAFT_1136485 [Hymenopellis radicata]
MSALKASHSHPIHFARVVTSNFSVPINWITKPIQKALRPYVRAVVFANGYPLGGSMIPSADAFPNLYTLQPKNPYCSYSMGLDPIPPPPPRPSRLSLSPRRYRPSTSLKHLAFETYVQAPGLSASLWCPGSAVNVLDVELPEVEVRCKRDVPGGHRHGSQLVCGIVELISVCSLDDAEGVV